MRVPSALHVLGAAAAGPCSEPVQPRCHDGLGLRAALGSHRISPCPCPCPQLMCCLVLGVSVSVNQRVRQERPPGFLKARSPGLRLHLEAWPDARQCPSQVAAPSPLACLAFSAGAVSTGFRQGPREVVITAPFTQPSDKRLWSLEHLQGHGSRAACLTFLGRYGCSAHLALRHLESGHSLNGTEL